MVVAVSAAAGSTAAAGADIAKAFSVRALTVGERGVLFHPLCKRRTKDGAPRVL